MKYLLVFPLLLIGLAVSAQTPWPRSPETDSVEFTGVIPWQSADTATAQRRLRVQQWFYERLRDLPPTPHTSWASKYDNAPLTRISLAGDGYFVYHKVFDYFLLYKVMLSPTAEGMKYRLSSFTWGWKTGHSSTVWPLESLPKLLKPDRLSLQVFRERLSTTLVGW